VRAGALKTTTLLAEVDGGREVEVEGQKKNKQQHRRADDALNVVGFLHSRTEYALKVANVRFDVNDENRSCAKSKLKQSRDSDERQFMPQDLRRYASLIRSSTQRFFERARI
jgi:hypothetical protein